MYWIVLIIMIILQWNARSLIANGQEFKQFIYSQQEKPDILCIQESWLKPNLDFIITGYVTIRRDREEGVGGGCVTFVKEGIPYRVIDIGVEMETIIIEIWIGKRKLEIINFYNPCRKLDINKLEEMEGKSNGNTVWCGDFNAHNTLWGSEKNDSNGEIVEEMLDGQNLVCVNDGRGTRIDVNTGKESAIDLTIVTNVLAPLCEWNVYKKGTIGSDHYPIYIKINIATVQDTGRIGGRWILEKANWIEFTKESGKNLDRVNDNMEVEMMDRDIKQGIISAANRYIPKSSGRKKNKLVPWWDEKCKQAIKSRNKAFKLVKRYHNFQNLIQYKQAQAMVRKTIRQAKRSYWRKFCGSIGSKTKIGEV